ncbi:hypothetical protein VCRA2123E76_220058 [Vibrio crassostreae]|nr:hypothetical protein VCRA2123E76_220058 [Vibrio crassostreae]
MTHPGYEIAPKKPVNLIMCFDLDTKLPVSFIFEFIFIFLILNMFFIRYVHISFYLCPAYWRRI